MKPLGRVGKGSNRQIEPSPLSEVYGVVTSAWMSSNYSHGLVQ